MRFAFGAAPAAGKDAGLSCSGVGVVVIVGEQNTKWFNQDIW